MKKTSPHVKKVLIDLIGLQKYSSEPVFVNIGIDSEESISPAYVAWRAGTTNRVVVLARQAGNRFLDSLKGLQIRALVTNSPHRFSWPTFLTGNDDI